MPPKLSAPPQSQSQSPSKPPSPNDDTSTQHTLTASLALESSMEDTLTSITSLILRGLTLTTLPYSLSKTLSSSLTTLSLSHNNFSDLATFENLNNLTELNLNFNSCTTSSLRSLIKCVNMKALYLSNNKLDDTSLALLSTPNVFQNLETLNLFKNNLTQLPLALSAVSNLRKLKDVTFDGNALSSRSNYKLSVIRSCVRLVLLDGEEVSQLDYEMARDDEWSCDDGGGFSNRSGNSTNSNTNSYTNSNSKSNGSASNVVPKLPISSVSNSMSNSMSSTFGFNSDPVLLTYRAISLLNDAKKESPKSHDDDDDDDDDDGDSNHGEDEDEYYDSNSKPNDRSIQTLVDEIANKKKESRSFVGKLRNSSVSKGGRPSGASVSVSVSASDGDDKIEIGGEDVDNVLRMLDIRATTKNEDDCHDSNVNPRNDYDAAVAQCSASVNVNDPWEIIRQLVIKCETLTTDNKRLKAHTLNGTSSSTPYSYSGMCEDEGKEMKVEMEGLRKENCMMYLLSDENKSLKLKIEQLKNENTQLITQRERETTLTTETLQSHNFDNRDLSWKLEPCLDVDIPRGSSRSGSGGGSRPNTGSSRSQSGNSNNSRPTTAAGRVASLYNNNNANTSRPKTAAERISTDYLGKLRSEAGLTPSNPNDVNDGFTSEDEDDYELFELIARNENGLAEIRKELVDASLEFEVREEEGRMRKGLKSGSGSEKEEKEEKRPVIPASTSTSVSKPGGGLSVRQLLEIRRKEKEIEKRR